MRRPNRPNVATILQTLKDFQQDSAEYAFSRLYLDEDSSRRFLVADEVGLGKTMVARGIIAKALNLLWDQTDRIDIIYICSNAEIARQNIRRLDVLGTEAALPRRITLLPTAVRDLQQNKVNFISLTPGTSFDLATGLGRVDERALLYRLLKESWSLRGAGPLNVLQGNVEDASRFRERVRGIEREWVDRALVERFGHALDRHVKRQQAEGSQDIRSRFGELCERFQRQRLSRRIPQEDKEQRRRLIGEMRSLLAESCLEALEPDLIILDEFQRFKHLLREDNEAGMLANALFEYQDEQTKVRVLLLSATPYKMYTLAQEARDDDHYRDFLDTLRFLLRETVSIGEAERLLREYREELYRLPDDSANDLKRVRAELEALLRRVMIRTERLSATPDREGMLIEVPLAEKLRLEPQDLQTYTVLQRIAREVDVPDTLEFWKSSPYLLNFMDEYAFKRQFEEAIVDSVIAPKLVDLLTSRRGVLLTWKDVARYRAVDLINPRMRALAADVLDNQAWRLLWIPPSLTYYSLEGPFADNNVKVLTKRLVFSSWRVVPKAIACLVSYEAERRMFRLSEAEPENTPQARSRRTPLLRFTVSDERYTGLPVLAMLYPSHTLASVGDPLSIRSGLPDEPRVEEVLAEVRRRLQPMLSMLITGANTSGPEDESWYWAAPILLDVTTDESTTLRWWRQEDLASIWASGRDDEDLESRWTHHVDEARGRIVQGVKTSLQSLGRPPENLLNVLAEMAIGGPGVCCLRALARVCGGLDVITEVWALNYAARAGWAFRSLFNLPEVTALLRGLNPGEPYWRKVVQYCLAGGLQAVLDEYAHVLRETMGLQQSGPEVVAKSISDTLSSVLTLRTPNLRVDRIAVGRNGEVRITGQRMRGRLALRFQLERGETGEDITRPDLVRHAFNSPFWPFVLATTSVGQEGLDFHCYCHAVVHWNLPANPVDLEQREGRIHRYKGHAIRKNVARRFADVAFRSKHPDPWQALFEAAHANRPTPTDLVPYWVFPIEDGARIERHVLALPMSRDEYWLFFLRKALAIYRMVFGQPRQEDLASYLLERLSKQQIDTILDEFRIDLSPPRVELSRPQT